MTETSRKSINDFYKILIVIFSYSEFLSLLINSSAIIIKQWGLFANELGSRVEKSYTVMLCRLKK